MTKSPKQVAGEILDNFQDITGVPLSLLTYQEAMDGNFVDETLPLIERWLKSYYPSIDIYYKDAEILYEIDRLLAKKL